MGKIISFLLPAILIVIGVQFTRDYFSDTNKEKKATLQQLLTNGKDAEAVLDSEYTEKTVTIARIPVKTYEVKYSFTVDGKNYTGLQVSKTEPAEATVKVKYLPNDPSVNAAGAEQELTDLNEQQDSGRGLYVGLAIIAAGLGLGVYRYISYKKSQEA